MAEHHYLPSLKKGTNIPPPAVPGSWLPVSRREIEAIAGGLAVGDGAKGRGANSVPDVWARPLLFHSAIRPKSEHPLHEALQEEWRGLLSLIALSDYYNLPITLEPVPIEAGSSPLANALQQLAPPSVELERGKLYRWLDTALLRVGEVTVGALSPLTLVYTGVRDLPLTLRLVESGRLRTPSDPGDLRIVAQWVAALRDRLQPLLMAGQGPHTQITDDLNTLLNQWLDSILRSLGLSSVSELDHPGTDFRIAEPQTNSTWATLYSYDIYRELLRPAQIKRSGAASDLLLNRSRGSGDVVVITPHLLAQNLKVWDTFKSRDFEVGQDPAAAIARDFPGDHGTRIKGQDLTNHACWIRPEKYFLSDTLLASRNDLALIAESENGISQKDRRYVLPFRRELLDFFSPDHVADPVASRLNPRFEPIDGGVRFRFTLPLNSSVVGMVELQKDYRFKDPRAGEGTVRFFDPPPVYLFPRLRTKHWRRYFLFVSGTSTQVEPLPVPGSAVERVDRRRPDGWVHQISGDNSYPEALAISTSDGTNAGIVLLAGAKRQDGLSGSRAMTIGIDFGTSNTNVFILRPDANEPSPWTIDIARHLQPVFEVAPGSVIQDNLLPASPVQLPIATTLLIPDPATVEHLLLDYFVYFSDDYQLPDNVHSDIKWQDIVKTQQFVRSLLMLLLLEVVYVGAKRFRIIFSFPRAFSANQRQRLEQTWEDAVAELTQGAGRLLSVAEGLDPDLLKTQFAGLDREVEAVAAGEFFASRNEEGKYERITIHNPYDRASVETTAVCIDVGGGTSDICIWHRNERVLDSSVLLAGRQIGTWLRANATIRELLFSRRAALALKDVDSKPLMFSARLNQVLRGEEPEIAKNLITHGTHPEVDRLRLMLALEFGAILFYTATLLAGANRRDGILGGVANDIASEGVNIHWGGNAAKMLRWIDYGRFAEDGIAVRLLRAVLRNALADGAIASEQESVGNKLSPGHKSEVAGGLIVWTNVKQLHANKRAARRKDDDMVADGSAPGGVERDDSDEIFLGENVVVNDGPSDDILKFDEPVRLSRLFPPGGSSIVRNVTLDRLERFLKIINQVGLRTGLISDGKQIQLTEQLRKHIGRQVRGEFVTMASLEPAKRVVEPVFISEVKSLLDVLSHQG